MWVKRVREFHDSGLSAEEFAVRKSIELRTLKSWIRVLQKAGEAPPRREQPGFLPVSVLHAVKAPVAGTAVMVEIDLANGRRVRVHVKADTDFRRVADLLDAVEGARQC